MLIDTFYLTELVKQIIDSIGLFLTNTRSLWVSECIYAFFYHRLKQMDKSMIGKIFSSGSDVENNVKAMYMAGQRFVSRRSFG